MSNAEYKFVYFGTPDLSVNVLNALERAGFLPTVVVTAPDRERGRGQEVSPSPVSAWAAERTIETLRPTTLKDTDSLIELANTDWDFFVVAMYNAIIPARILSMPKKGCLNVHPSLLPKFRGPSPILSAILADERTTGVSIMLLDEQMDHGPILAQARIEIAPEDWPMSGSTLSELLSTEGGNLLAETIPQWMDGTITPEEQAHADATYTKKFTKEDARIDLAAPAYQNLLKIRAFDTNPRAFFMDEDGKRIIVTDADIVDGTLTLLSVIPEGRKKMSYGEYLHGKR